MTSQDIINFLNGFNPSGAALTPEQVATLATQLRDQVNQLSVAVPNTQGATTLLYSGQMGNGIHSGAVAQALADASPGQIVTINLTEVAALLDARNDPFHQTIGLRPHFSAGLRKKWNRNVEQNIGLRSSIFRSKINVNNDLTSNATQVNYACWRIASWLQQRYN